MSSQAHLRGSVAARLANTNSAINTAVKSIDGPPSAAEAGTISDAPRGMTKVATTGPARLFYVCQREGRLTYLTAAAPTSVCVAVPIELG